MKTLKIFVLAIFFMATAQAQVSVQVNMGNPPAWAPANGAKAQYYYLPEIDTYYDVPSQRFIYYDNSKWIRAEKLPLKFNQYNLRQGKIIYLKDYKGKSPYKYNKKHRVKYKTVMYTPHGIKIKSHSDNGKHKGQKKHKKIKRKKIHQKVKH